MNPEVSNRSEFLSMSLESGIQTAESYFRDVKKLPIMDQADLIKQKIKDYDTLLLEAETGSGKSTAGPVLVLSQLIKERKQPRIVVTQPRRPIVEQLSSYVGEQMGKDNVGFQHKQRKTISDDTAISFTMEGTLLNQIVEDPLLLKHSYDAVVLDEVHERNVNLDILIPMLKKIQAERKRLGHKALKIIMTSATLDREKLKTYFGDTEHIEVSGRMYPVEEHFSEETVDERQLSFVAAKKAREIIRSNKTKGNILIFRPGRGEISETIAQLKRELEGDETVEMLSFMGGSESSDDYQKILAENGKRKIIVASKVAQTSLTIPNLEDVIDDGLDRYAEYDQQSDMTVLRTKKHTKADAMQRKGRAGREKDGNVHYLFTKEELDSREDHLKPELLRTDLSAQILRLLHMEANPQTFEYIDHPGIEKVNQALEKLKMLGAVDDQTTITEIGKKMIEYDTNPNFARMLVEAKNQKCLDAVSVLVGIMSGRSVFNYNRKTDGSFSKRYEKFVYPESDFITALNIWNEYVKHSETKETSRIWGDENHINTKSLYHAWRTKQDLHREDQKNPTEVVLSKEKIDGIIRSVLAGMGDKIVFKNKFGGYNLAAGGKAVQIGDQSVLSGFESPDYFVSGSLFSSDRSQKTFATYNSVVTKDLIREFLKNFQPTDEKDIHDRRENDVPVTPEKTENTPEPSPQIEQSEEKEHADQPQTHEQPREPVHHPLTQSQHSYTHHEVQKKTFLTKITSPFRKFLEKIKSIFRKNDSHSGH